MQYEPRFTPYEIRNAMRDICFIFTKNAYIFGIRWTLMGLKCGFLKKKQEFIKKLEMLK